MSAPNREPAQGTDDEIRSRIVDDLTRARRRTALRPAVRPPFVASQQGERVDFA